VASEKDYYPHLHPAADTYSGRVHTNQAVAECIGAIVYIYSSSITYVTFTKAYTDHTHSIEGIGTM